MTEQNINLIEYKGPSMPCNLRRVKMASTEKNDLIFTSHGCFCVHCQRGKFNDCVGRQSEDGLPLYHESDLNPTPEYKQRPGILVNRFTEAQCEALLAKNKSQTQETVENDMDRDMILYKSSANLSQVDLEDRQFEFGSVTNLTSTDADQAVGLWFNEAYLEDHSLDFDDDEVCRTIRFYRKSLAADEMLLTTENVENFLKDTDFNLPLSLNPLANVTNEVKTIMGLITIDRTTIVFHFSTQTGVLYTIDPFDEVKSVLKNEKITNLMLRFDAWYRKTHSEAIKIRLKKLKLKKVTKKAEKVSTKLFTLTVLIRYKDTELLKALEIQKCHVTKVKNLISTQCEQRSILSDYFSFTV